MLSFVVTILVAAIGGFIGRKLKLPAGTIIGAMIAVLLMNIFFDYANVPNPVRPYIRIMAGIYIGTRMSMQDVLNLRTILPATLMMVFGLIFLNSCVGLGISAVSDLDVKTALLASAPGGIQEMTLVADDLGADAGQVAILQTVRVIFVIAFMPALLKRAARYDNKPEILPASQGAAAAKPTYTWKHYAMLAVAGLIGGLSFHYLGIPSGAMIGAMAGAMVLTFAGHRVQVPADFRNVTQTLSGAIIGSGMGMAEVQGLRLVALPALILVLALAAINLILGFTVAKFGHLGLTTSLFASAPGGVSDMSIIAAELGADPAKVAAMQTLRMIVVVALFPTLTNWISQIL